MNSQDKPISVNVYGSSDSVPLSKYSRFNYFNSIKKIKKHLFLGLN